MRLLLLFALIVPSICIGQCDLSVQDIVSKINCDSLVAQCPSLGGMDTNTEYKFDAECTNGTFLLEIFSSDGNTDDAIKLDLQDCIDVCNTWISSSSFDNTNQDIGYQEWSFGLQDDCGNSFNVNGRDDFAYLSDDCEITFPNGKVLDIEDCIDYPIEPWNVQNTTNEADQNTQNIYQNANVGIGNFSGQTIGDDLHVLTGGGGGITIENTAINQTSPYLTFQNPDNTAETVLTPRDGNAFGVEYGGVQYFEIRDDGRLQADEYGQGNFTGTAAYDLCVDANGVIIEQLKVDNVDDAVANCIDVVACLPADLADGDDDEQTLSQGLSNGDLTYTISISNGNSISVDLDTTMSPIYEYRDQWANEGGGAVDGSAQYSYGNGSTGFIGLPYDDGWEIIAVYLMTDNNGANDDLSIDIKDYQTNPSAAAPTIASVQMTNSGDGQANNGYVYTDLINSPESIPNGAVLGFITNNETGTVSDIQVGFRARRKVGDYVSDIKFN